MTLRCENCGRPLLEDDAECFHCGEPSPRDSASEPATEKEQIDLRTVGLFAAVVLGLAILGMVLLNWMGADYSDPLEATPAAPAGWRQFISPGADYVSCRPDSLRAYTPLDTQWDSSLVLLVRPLEDSFRPMELSLRS